MATRRVKSAKDKKPPKHQATVEYTLRCGECGPETEKVLQKDLRKKQLCKKHSRYKTIVRSQGVRVEV